MPAARHGAVERPPCAAIAAATSGLDDNETYPADTSRNISSTGTIRTRSGLNGT